MAESTGRSYGGVHLLAGEGVVFRSGGGSDAD
ncbi:helix-turn-helix domain-containing protein [Streptomyces sp. NPDC055059]